MRHPPLVFTSSISVYGPTEDLVSEQSPTAPVSAYGRSKLAAEHGLAELGVQVERGADEVEAVGVDEPAPGAALVGAAEVDRPRVAQPDADRAGRGQGATETMSGGLPSP